MVRFSETVGSSRWITVIDVKESKGPLCAQIERMSEEMMWDQQERRKMPRWVIWLRGWDKGLVLNVTRGRPLANSFGDEMSTWTHQWIELYVDASPQDRKQDMVHARPRPEPTNPPTLGDQPVLIERLNARMKINGIGQDTLAKLVRGQNEKIGSKCTYTKLNDWPATPEALQAIADAFQDYEEEKASRSDDD